MNRRPCAFDASAIDYEVSLTDGRYASGDREAEEFVEYWTFIRRRGARTISGQGLIEGHCPNCGAAIEMNQNATCTHCKAFLKSGQYDWVLCEITQESEYREQTDRGVRGLDVMRQVDPELTLEELEDRASVIFWRRQAASRLNDLTPLRKVALDSYSEKYQAELHADERGDGRFWFGECGVGSVDTMAIVRNDDFDRAIIDIHWSGSRFVQKAGEPPRKGEQTPVFRSVFVLARKPGVKSSADRGITSAHCPNCGAPVSSTDSNACEFCGTVLNDGSHGWVLEDAMGADSARIRELMDPLGPDAMRNGARPSAGGILAWMVQMAGCDGNIDDKEKRMLLQTAQLRNVPAERINGMIAAMANGGMNPPQPANREQAIEWLGEMAEMALADGQVSNAEWYLLRKAGSRIGFADADLKLMLKRAQSQMLERARAALQQKNQG